MCTWAFQNHFSNFSIAFVCIFLKQGANCLLTYHSARHFRATVLPSTFLKDSFLSRSSGASNDIKKVIISIWRVTTRMCTAHCLFVISSLSPVDSSSNKLIPSSSKRNNRVFVWSCSQVAGNVERVDCSFKFDLPTVVFCRIIHSASSFGNDRLNRATKSL